MNAALNVAEQGFKAIIVEKQPHLGGLLNRINTIGHEHGEKSAEEILKATEARVEANPNIKVYTGAEIERSRVISATIR